MPDRLFQVELAARNFRFALEANPAEVIEWDEGSWRGPRVLVPIVVDALPIGASEPSAATRAAVGIDPIRLGAPRPAPFDTITGMPAGVHLHWALPDGLTRGTQQDPPPDAPLPAGTDTSTERPETATTQRLKFPGIPDRWLVVRIVAGATDTAPRTATAWVIESALDPALRRVTLLSSFTEDRADEPAAPLTAMGPGEPIFAVYYENTQNIFGFHDSLDGVVRGPLTYLVTGWFSEPSRDPLHIPDTESAWYSALQQLGWSLPQTSLDRLNAAAREFKRKQEQLGIKTRRRDAGPLFHSASSAGTDEGTMRIGSAASRISKVSGADVFLSGQAYFEQHWPRQILCHGAVFDVAWNGRGGAFDTADAGVPAAERVTVVVGNSGAQALGALIAATSGDPGLERAMAAFHSGALADLSLESGIARLESGMHSDDFISTPGGFVLAEIEQGDIFPPASGVESAARPSNRSATEGSKSSMFDAVGSLKVSRNFFKANIGLADLLDTVSGAAPSSTEPVGEAPAGSPRRTETVRRSMPRWYQPRDPVVLVNEARRSYKHGEDGWLDPNGKLVCRVAGETVSRVGVNPWINESGITMNQAPLIDIRGSELTTSSFRTGQIPAECGALFYETLLLDPTVVPVARGVILDKAGRQRASAPSGARMITASEAGSRFIVEQTLPYWAYLTQNIDVQALAAMSKITGTTPSKLALQLWRRPWNPIELSWEVAWYPSPRGERDWILGETDFELLEFDPEDHVRDNSLPTGTEGSPALVIQGRTLLTPGVAHTMEMRLRKFLAEEAAGVADDATPTQEQDLARVARQFSTLDVLSTALGGTHLSLMARRPVPGVEGSPDPNAWEPISAQSVLWLLRAGHLRLQRVRIIDTFGQFCDVAAATLDRPIVAEDMKTRAGPAMLLMPPRLQEPARLMFRLLDPNDNGREATRDRSPVCGWVVPDHLDEALEIFDERGSAVGQLQPADDGRTLEWQGVPGQQAPLGAPPDIGQVQVAGLVNGLLQWGLRDRDRGTGVEPTSESALAALLRMIDATLWTNDPVGRAGNEHLSVIIGHPMAIVRSELRLEVQSETDARSIYVEARKELERTPMPVRLGELLALDDGLIGYFINDDYSRFYPVHESLAPEARPSGPSKGFLGSAADEPDMTPVAVQHPYIARDPVVRVRPGSRVMLTLLVDPRGAIHATSGIVPRKKIELMREHIAPALDAMALTFRVGPVLVDPDTIRMPVPAEIKGGWSWVRKVNVTTWQEDQVVKATQDALLPDVPALLSEGWLKVSGALQNDEQSRPSTIAGDV
ncbi:MAG: hypothetical protein ABI681_06690 [Gemmatimonadales bacterium]